ncbi:hypothetical protein RSK20926_00305 [Roseobacter sp. SK209-2-6]|uniref:hypothetical protein n=1 Tax=Roseobacter sp. SK209-2-6 TaxID=388739 RepID=UPI0000F3C2BB|nr:hypothetical protein [Roseobacter sp. SK209-2-6]EBA15347.1 hypothetical protein RSK20926_00305 [Roseobacter sp. SK209-2-6]
MQMNEQYEHGQGASDELMVLSCSTGLEFLQRFVEILADCFEADLVTIGELKVMERECIRVLASSFDSKSLGEMEYEAGGTPCQDVVKSARQQTFLRGIQKDYPLDEMFVQENIQSYIGFPLTNKEGAAIGLIQAAWRREIDQEEADHLTETVGLFLLRLSAELETLHAMRILSALALGHNQQGSNDPIALLCEQMQAALKVRWVIVSETYDKDPSCYRLLSKCQDGIIEQGAMGELRPYEGSPCNLLKNSDQVFIPDGLPERFPDHPGIRSQKLVSYLGQNIRAEDGTLLGHFAILHDGALQPRTSEADLFKLFAARVASELRQMRKKSAQSHGFDQRGLTQADKLAERLAHMDARISELNAEQDFDGVTRNALEHLSNDITASETLLKGIKNSVRPKGSKHY